MKKTLKVKKVLTRCLKMLTEIRAGNKVKPGKLDTLIADICEVLGVHET